MCRPGIVSTRIDILEESGLTSLNRDVRFTHESGHVQRNRDVRFVP